MFHRSSRSQSRSAPATRNNVNATASATAHSAAAQAFLANRQSAPNLSASAAAAALRTMSPPPTNVGATQTKRTLQRQLSNSSNGSSTRGRGSAARPGLQRSGSSGSMTERTFRSPSPGRPGSRGGRETAPPVPTLSGDYSDIPPIPNRTHRRVVSLEPMQRRVLSPPTTKGVGRGQSLDRGPVSIPPSQRAAQKAAAPTAPRSPSLQKINELERSDSQSSINFSYPRSARPNSPPARAPVARPGEHHFPSSMRSGTVPSNAQGVGYDVVRAAEQPVKKKKKIVAKGAAEGSHFQNAGMGGKPIVTPLEPPHATTEAPPPDPAKKKKKKAAVSEESPHFHDSVSSQDGSDHDSTPEKSADRRTQRASGILNKQPSVVREDWEGEQEGTKNAASSEQPKADQNFSPVSSPVEAVQSRKTPTEANVSKKIDEPTSPQRQSQAQPIHDAVTLSPPSTKQAENRKHLAVAGSDVQHTRTASISPSRSFRFSDHLSSDLAAGQKHEPLPRSVSPAKSAMRKQSPSPNATSPLNGNFPTTLRNSSQTPSEASDNTSLMSADGFGPSARRKKATRVSFDPEPEVVGVSAQQNEIESPPPASPQTKESGKKGWFGLGKSKGPALGTIPAEDDMEEVMTPRPALPFFGSVRNKPRGNESWESTPVRQRQPTTVTTTPSSGHFAATSPSTSSEASSTSNLHTMNTPASSDHAIGGILAQEALKGKTQPPTVVRANNLPLPPEVTSVEGSGYVSDTDSDTEIQEQQPKAPVAESSMSEVTAPAQTAAATLEVERVPTIEVHPATPGLEQGETLAQDQWQVLVPGGFPSSAEHLAGVPSPETGDQSKADVRATSPAGLGIAEPSPAETVGVRPETDPPLNTLSQALLDRHNGETEDRNSDADSIYSDAAESQADFEGDGFGSINAIVESPVVASPPTNRMGTIPESPLSRNTPQGRPEGENRTASWDEAQAHWSGVAERYRQGVHQSPQQEAQVPVLQDAKPKTKKKSKTPGASAAAAAAVPALQKYPDSSPPTTPPSKPRDARAPQAARGKATTSGQTPNRQSMPTQTGLAPALNLRNQPVPSATAAPAPKQRGALQKRKIPAGVTGSPSKSMRPASSSGKTTKAILLNDSDSESSFRKQRQRARSGDDGVYSMRRSMRSSQPTESQRPSEPAGRGGIRSLSPVNRRPFSPVGGQKPMRTSMRGSIDSNASGPTLRGSPAQQRSSSLFGRSKPKAQNLAPPVPSKPLTSKIKSRFADSDDEDDAAPRSYRSRFEDSSDDEPEPVKFRPVRGIPRKADEGESTDLEDSSDDEAQVPPPKQVPKINTQQTNTAPTEAPQSPISPTSEKKRGFFGRFRSKKEKNSTSKSKLGVGTIAERDAMLEKTRPDVQAARDRDREHLSATNKKTKEDKSHPSRLGFASAAERDAMIERTRQQLEEAKESQDQVPDTNGPTSVGGSQRRATPQRITSDSWPLPPKMPAAKDDRPNTSDGVDVASDSGMRPGLNGRKNTSDTLRSAGGTVVYGRSGKKKRFPMLRRAFGLTD